MYYDYGGGSGNLDQGLKTPRYMFFLTFFLTILTFFFTVYSTYYDYDGGSGSDDWDQGSGRRGLGMCFFL